MVLELPDLGAHRVVAGLPDLDADALLPACEVLGQEGFKVWSVPAAQLAELPALLRVFRRRARIGVHGVTRAAEVVAAADAGAAFAASVFMLPELVAAAPALPVVLGGMTPTELRAGMAAGAAAVQLVPSEAFGTSYARTLPGLLDPFPVLAGGKIERYQADLWLEAGGAGVWPTQLVAREPILAENLDELRVTLQQWRLGD